MTSATQIAVERRGRLVVARLGGEVDMTNAAYVGEELSASTPNDAAALVIDLSGARYLDSAGVTALFSVARRLGRRRQALRLVVPSGSPLQKLFEVTDMGTVASLHERLDEALEADDGTP